MTYDLSAQLSGWLINPGAASVKVDFLDANQTYLGITAAIGPVNLFDRFFEPHSWIAAPPERCRPEPSTPG